MTQRNIDVMDIIVNKIVDGAKLSKALESVYTKRSVCIPLNKKYSEVELIDLGMSRRTTNSFLRAKMRTLGELITFCNSNKKITDISGIGKDSGIEAFEFILDYCWGNMEDDERVSFLIDTVERNEAHIRAEIA